MRSGFKKSFLIFQEKINRWGCDLTAIPQGSLIFKGGDPR